MAWRKSSSYTGESFLKLLEMQKYNSDVFQVHLEKQSTSCHISKQGCLSHQRFWPSKCEFLALRTSRKENNTCDQATIRLQSFPTVRTEEFRMGKITGCWRQIAEIWKEWFQWAQTVTSSHTWKWKLLGCIQLFVTQNRIMEWVAIPFSRVAYPFSSGFSRPRNQTGVSAALQADSLPAELLGKPHT